MKRTFLCIFLIAFLIGRSESGQNQVSGKWAADLRTKGGLGALYVFSSDGTVTATFGALVDFSYQVEGKTLITTFKGDDSEKPVQVDTESYEIVADKLILNPAIADKRQEMTRTGAPREGAHPIVGSWTYKHYTGVDATMQYTTNGLAQLSVPFIKIEGRYKVQDNELVIDFKDKPISKRKIRLEGDRLTFLADSDKKEEKYTRVLP